MTTLERARSLHDWILEGRILEALDEFYAEDVAMQEGLGPATHGREANREREAAWLATVKEFVGLDVRGIAVDGDISLSEVAMDYIDVDGNAVHVEQVSRARWRDGRIVDERFYSAAPEEQS